MLNILKDDLSAFAGRGAAFVTFGETMVRDTPAGPATPRNGPAGAPLARRRRVHAGNGAARFGIPGAYIARADNPYGWLIRDFAQGQGVTPTTSPGRRRASRWAASSMRSGAPARASAGTSACTPRPADWPPSMVDWSSALAGCQLLHTSGITFGLAAHSKYERNFLLETFEEAVAAMPDGCRVGLDPELPRPCVRGRCRAVLTPLIKEHVSIVVTTIEDMAVLYGLGCGPYSAEQIDKGDLGPVSDADLQAFAEQVRDLFAAEIVALTLRYPDSFEVNRWESAALDAAGHFVRSAAVHDIVLLDRLGGGDTWNGGFYYGLLTAGFGAEGLEKGVLVGDAATRLKQTLMFDLPVVTKAEVQDLLRADIAGGGKRVAR